MSGDALCVGVCLMDWDAGVCLGCGRTTDEIHGVAAEPPPEATTLADDQSAPVPAKPAAQGGASRESGD